MEPGLKGFLCTCNGMEKQCVAECFNLLNEYADKLYPKEKPALVEAKTEGDISEQFDKELAEIKGNGKSDFRFRFNVVNTGVANCIFIKTSMEDPTSLIHFMMKDLLETKQAKARFLMRITPVEITCRAVLDDMKKSIIPLIEKYFGGEPTTFSIMFSRKHNNSVDRDVVIKEIAELVSDANDQHKVNLTQPALTIMIDVMKFICCIAVVREYMVFSKYNIQVITGNITNKPNKEVEVVNQSSDGEVASKKQKNENLGDEESTKTDEFASDQTKGSGEGNTETEASNDN